MNMGMNDNGHNINLHMIIFPITGCNNLTKKLYANLTDKVYIMQIVDSIPLDNKQYCKIRV